MNKNPEIPIGPTPKGYHTVTQWIMSRNFDQLIKFIEAAFNGKEMGRVHNKDGSIGHAEIRVGDSVIMMFDKQPAWPDLPALTRLYVDDADVTYRQALEAGAKSVTEVTHLAFGDEVGRMRDHWAIYGAYRPTLKTWTLEKCKSVEATRPLGKQWSICNRHSLKG